MENPNIYPIGKFIMQRPVTEESRNHFITEIQLLPE